MQAIAINCSPRAHANTAQLLKAALGATAEQGAKTRFFNLYDLNVHGCRSCFACKRLGGPSFGRCALHDDLKPLLDNIVDAADILLVGSPVYYKSVTAGARAFIERSIFPLHDYSPSRESLLKRNVAVGFIYTMNAGEKALQNGYDAGWSQIGNLYRNFYGSYSEMFSCDTLQFSDYSKFASSAFDPVHKREHHEQQFPNDIASAQELGRHLVSEAQSFQ